MVVLALPGSLAAAIVVLVIGALLVCTGSECVPPAWELRVLEWFAAQRHPALDALFVSVTWLGSLWLLLPLALALGAAQVAGGHGANAARFTTAFGGAVALAYVAKSLVARVRPTVLEPLVAMPLDSSFPSGHAMQITAFSLAAILTLAPPTQRAWWFAPAFTAIVLVGASRLYLQVHFPSDVLAGTAAAALWVFGFAAANKERHA
jgi:membrane-associated phospholipid phosphatase